MLSLVYTEKCVFLKVFLNMEITVLLGLDSNTSLQIVQVTVPYK